MSYLPKNLGLSAHQKALLKAAFTRAAVQERYVLMTVSGRFRQMNAIGKVARKLQSEESKFLTPKQFALVNSHKPMVPAK